MCTANLQQAVLGAGHQFNSPQTRASAAEASGRTLAASSRDGAFMSNAEKLIAGRAAARGLIESAKIRGRLLQAKEGE